MTILYIILGLLILELAVSLFNVYNPKIELVVSYNKYIILFWYNKYDFMGGFDRRVHKKICEFKCGKL